MLDWLRRLWTWLKRRLFGWSSDVGERPRQFPVSEPSDQAYENCLFDLLTEAEEGASWGRLQSVLFHNGIEAAKLSDWLQSFSGRWLAEPDGHQALAKQLRQLGQIAGAPLGPVALAIGQQLELSQPQESASSASAESALTEQMKTAASARDFERVLALSEQYIEQCPDKAWGYNCSSYSLSGLGRHEDAIARLDQALALDPKDITAWLNRGILLRNLGRYEDSIGGYDQALALDPKNVIAWLNRGNSLSNLGRYEESLASYDQALALDPTYVFAWLSHGNSLSNLGRHEEAIASYDQALALDPKNVIGWVSLGYSFNQLGRYEESLASSDQALALDPKFVSAWVSRGLSLSNLGRDEAAVPSYGQALALDPKFVSAWVSRGISLSKLGYDEEAISSYDQALALDLKDVSAWFNRGLSLSNLGRDEEAISSYDHALALDPTDADTWINRGNSLNKLGRYEKSLLSSDQALLLDLKKAIAWLNRGLSLSNLGRDKEAILSYDQVLALDPKFVRAWFNRGLSLSNLGRDEEAILSYDQALALDPKFVRAWLNRGYSLGNLGRDEEAISSYDQILFLDPKDIRAWFSRGILLSKLGRHEEAISSSDQALSIDPTYISAWLNRGRAAYRSPSYRPTGSSQFIVDVQLSLSQSKEQLLTTWQPHDTEALLESLEHSVARFAQQLQQSAPHLPQMLNEGLSPALRQFLQQPADPVPLRTFLRQPIPAKVLQQIENDQPRQPSHINPDLNQRGYAGELASYHAALDTAISKTDMPDGWAQLHQAIGTTHLREARQRLSPRMLWQQAASSFKRALTAPGLDTLNPKLYLKLLTELITVSTDLGEHQSAQVLQSEGHGLIKRLVDDERLSLSQRRDFGLMASRFDQLSVDSFIQLQQPTEALVTAEAGKRLCLRWLLGIDEVPDVDLAQLRLDAHQAIVYWHLSPSRLTTFVLLPGERVPRIISMAPQGDDRGRPAWLQHHDDWRAWLQRWNERYRNYIALGKRTSRERESHPWREAMPEALKQLRALLNVDGIKAALSHSNIRELWLLPHRDLHRFPLHGFFADYTCTYLPYLSMEALSTTLSALPLTPLLLVENPKHQATAGQGGSKKVLAELPFAEVEAAFLRQLFPPPQSQTLGAQDATQDQLVTALAGDSRILHFSGHGVYDSHRPSQSCLFLSGAERLTLLDIAEQDLSSYALVTLAACETAMTGNETITDEYVGLVSACLSAGAGAVLSTLWRVESEASMVLMVEFYRHLKQGLSLAEALKRAQRFPSAC